MRWVYRDNRPSIQFTIPDIATFEIAPENWQAVVAVVAQLGSPNENG